ncbi:MAG: A/G-specific adenine glycosylase [Lachnospiraceae bacterium]|nr:A/G-specific adenine glycosylase [Lachnospiraceae bacterium]
MNVYEEMIPYLLHWYRYNARVLPWREDPSAYHVWISEIMLQQTRVEAVRAYYMRFLEELPDVKALAECPDDRLMKLWEGLGYYSRARNLKKAAEKVIADYEGIIPSEASELRKLPGIGDYTAGAVSSIAYGRPEPAVDGNVLRVMSRLTGSRDDILSADTKKRITAELKAVMPGEESGALNQAIMDIGATICIPNGAPHCEECPLTHICTAFHNGTTGEIPVRAAKTARRTEKKTVLLIGVGDRILLHKRPAKGLLAGLYEYPNVPGHIAKKDVPAAVSAILSDAMGEQCAEPVAVKKADDAKHVFSHIEWQMKAYRADVRMCGTDLMLSEGYVLVTTQELKEQYSVPSAFAKWDV